MNKINLMADWIVEIKSAQGRDKPQRERERNRNRERERERDTADCGKLFQ